MSPPFTWGVATSAYQIEGGRFDRGKGQSIWDRFSDLGRLRDRGDIACDHFHRWEEDLDLIARLGVQAYRFSVAWTRVIPDGDGEINDQGLGFYHALLEGMAERGIRPYLTLYHWDLPQALQDRGGWANRETVAAFARYARVLAENYGDLVSGWITQNEPWVSSMLGNQTGFFPPGLRDWYTALRVCHHLLLSHGRAVEEIRDVSPRARVGIALDCRPVSPASDRLEDVAAAMHFDGYRNRWCFDPVFGRGYPEDMMRAYRDCGRLPEGLDFVLGGDLGVISNPLDFLGLNYYTTLDIAAGREESEEPEVEMGVDAPPGFTEMAWRIDAGGLERYLLHLHETYSPQSILITENGASFSDGPDETDHVDDQRRIAYLRDHIASVAGARAAGVPVDGYFVWSLLDNLEWVEGFSQRFGLVWVDFDSQERIPKASYDWYSKVVRQGAPGLQAST